MVRETVPFKVEEEPERSHTICGRSRESLPMVLKTKSCNLLTVISKSSPRAAMTTRVWKTKDELEIYRTKRRRRRQLIQDNDDVYRRSAYRVASKAEVSDGWATGNGSEHENTIYDLQLVVVVSNDIFALESRFTCRGGTCSTVPPGRHCI